MGYPKCVILVFEPSKTPIVIEFDEEFEIFHRLSLCLHLYVYPNLDVKKQQTIKITKNDRALVWNEKTTNENLEHF